MKRSKIALFGIFGVQNLGNECTLQAMLHNVRQLVPDAEIYSICYGPQDTSRRHELAAVPIVSGYSRNAKSGQLARPRSMVTKFLRRLFRWLPAELLDWFRAFKALRGTNLVVMTGTGMLTDYSTSCFGYPYDIFKWTIAAKLAGCKVRFVGIGVGPIYERLSRAFIKSALTLADYRSFRDHPSKTRLEKLGFETGNDPVLPDLAFSLPRCILPHCSNHRRQKRIVGLGVMNHVDGHTAAQRNRETTYDAYLEKMCDLATWLVEHGYAIRILQGDAKYDRAARSDFRARLEQRGFRYDTAGIIDEDSTTVEDLLAQLADVDLVISPRFHNLLLALMLYIPVVSISYDAKNDALLEGFGLGKYCQPMADLNVQKLIDQFVDIESKSEQMKPLLRKTVERYRNLLDEQYHMVLDHP